MKARRRTPADPLAAPRAGRRVAAGVVLSPELIEALKRAGYLE